jgi:hypothetical protein
MGALQWIGLFLLLMVYTAVLAGFMLLYWPAGSEPWWQKVIDAYGWYLILWGTMVLVILGGNWLARRNNRRHSR